MRQLDLDEAGYIANMHIPHPLWQQQLSYGHLYMWLMDDTKYIGHDLVQWTMRCDS